MYKRNAKQNNMENIIKFEEGNIYQMSYIGDSELKPHYICIKRTAKTATFQLFQNPDSEPIRRKINNHDGVEYILKGSYSMAPVIRANKIVG